MKKIKLKLLAIAAMLAWTFISKSLAQAPASDSSDYYLRQFYKFDSGDLDAKTALFCLQKVSQDKRFTNRLASLIHDDFAQSVLKATPPSVMDSVQIDKLRRVPATGKQMLQMAMDGSNRPIKHVISPMFLYIEIRDAGEDNAKPASLTDRFIREELSDPDIYSNRAGRYALMLYTVLRSRKGFEPRAELILKKVTAYLKDGQITFTDSNTDDKEDERIWFKYLYAYANVLNADQTTDLNKKKEYLKRAFDYSPNLQDRNRDWAYFYDMHSMLNREKHSFQDDYLNFIIDHTPGNSELFSVITEITLKQPEFKEKLKAAYIQSGGKNEEFANYWIKLVNENGQTGFPISLTKLDKSLFTNKPGKWLLVDFWGTWCMPCRKEHPDLQKFYESMVKLNSDKIELLTIACRDTEARVSQYLQEKQFSFPVALSDNKVEHTYKVPGYPTKLLFSPQGKFVLVPHGADWVSFVKNYADL